MKLKLGFRALLLGILLYFTPAPATGQVTTEGPDSVLVAVADTSHQTSGFFLSNLKELDRPAKAALWSAVIPGAGQFYNKSYWKIPIVWATGAVLGYFWIDNNNKYQEFRSALNIRSGQSSVFYEVLDPYHDHASLGVNTPNGTNSLRYRRDYYRRNRDLTILLSIGAHALQIAEAYVHAHLKDFDVSDNLAIRVQPNLLPVVTMPGSPVPGLTFTLYTRTK